MQTTLTIPNTVNKIQWRVSFRVLLGLYSIIPFCLMLQLSDYFLFNQWLLENLPSSPAHFLLFQLLFGTPHIIASSLLLGSNIEYLKFYKTKLIGMSLLIIVSFGIGSLLIPYRGLYIIVACWTVYHVLKQQIGVGRGLYSLPNRLFYSLLWLSISAGILIYLGIFLKNSLNPSQEQFIRLTATFLTLGLIIITLLSQNYANNLLGKYFLWANTLLIVGSLYLYSQKYYFLAVLMPRLVHDATAYIFYITHDYNKHAQQPQNWLYRQARNYRISIFLVLPISSVLLTVILQQYGNDWVEFITRTLLGIEIHKAVTLGFIGYLSLMHYYTEAFTWKHGSPLRQFIAFK